MSTIEVGDLPYECTVEIAGDDGARSRPRGLRGVTRWIVPLAAIGTCDDVAADLAGER